MRVATKPGRQAGVLLGFPSPSYLWKVVLQSARLWVLARLLIFAILWLATGDPTIGLFPTWTTRAFVVAVTGLLVWWDRKRSHELLLHANLGASPGWFWAAALLTASVLDVAVQLLLGVF